jgi:hypothetical protein
MWRDNRSLRDELTSLQSARAADPWAVSASPARGDDGGGAVAIAGSAPADSGSAARPVIRMGGERPALPDEKAGRESRLDRRARRQEEITSMLGRFGGETAEEYRERVMPMMEMFLTPRRATLEEMRREAEEAAGITAAQREELDAAFADVYDEVLAYTNEAVASGDVTPYERNISGMLQYSGGLGAILQGANQRIGSVLSAEQMQAIYGSGFEWAEYLGMNVPWEQLNPPPPPRDGN